MRRSVDGSPAWNPQATLADVTRSSIAASSPSVQRPNDSPRSEFRSICRLLSASPAACCITPPYAEWIVARSGNRTSRRTPGGARVSPLVGRVNPTSIITSPARNRSPDRRPRPERRHHGAGQGDHRPRHRRDRRRAGRNDQLQPSRPGTARRVPGGQRGQHPIRRDRSTHAERVHSGRPRPPPTGTPRSGDGHPGTRPDQCHTDATAVGREQGPDRAAGASGSVPASSGASSRMARASCSASQSPKPSQISGGPSSTSAARTGPGTANAAATTAGVPASAVVSSATCIDQPPPIGSTVAGAAPMPRSRMNAQPRIESLRSRASGPRSRATDNWLPRSASGSRSRPSGASWVTHSGRTSELPTVSMMRS